MYGCLDGSSGALVRVGLPLRVSRTECVLPAVDSQPCLFCSNGGCLGDAGASPHIHPSFPAGKTCPGSPLSQHQV